MPETRDRWYRWLCEVRHGGDPAQQELVRQALYPVCDKVLDRACLGAADTRSTSAPVTGSSPSARLTARAVAYLTAGDVDLP